MSDPAFQGHLKWSGENLPNLFSTNAALKKLGMVHTHLDVQGERGIHCAVFGTIFNAQEEQDAGAGNPAEFVCSIYQNLGRIPDDLNGEFCLCLWDEAKGKLILISDAVRSRPLYYVANDEGVAFSCDIAALLPVCRSPVVPDSGAVRAYLCADTKDLRERTFLSEVKKVPPATMIAFEQSGSRSRLYWDPARAPDLQFDSNADCYEAGRKILAQCVQDRMHHAGKSAVHLSGGLDSSLITALVCKMCEEKGLEKPLAYAWQPGAGQGETLTLDQDLFETACAEFGLSGNYVASDVMIEASFLSIDPVVEPATSVLSLELPVMKKAQGENVQTLFSGWGGDQVVSFSGKPERETTWWHFLTKIAPRRVLKKRRLVKNYSILGTKRESRLFGLISSLKRRTVRDTQLDNLLLNDNAERMDSWSVFAAKHGFQYSYPLLDRRLIEFALGAPDTLFWKDGVKRNLMRELMKGAVSDKIRLNLDKDEPARFENSFRLFEATGKRVLPLLLQGRYDQERAQFVDLDLLKQDVQRMANGEKVPFGKVYRALSFLNLSFQSTSPEE